MLAGLDNLLKSTPHLWKGDRLLNRIHGISTGYKKLDALLPEQGWPLGRVTELLPEAMGIGELRLILPAIRNTTQQKQRVLIINAPYQPYTPALANASIDLDYLFLISAISHDDALWAAEKALHSKGCKILLLWPDFQGKRPVDNSVIRRLQVAAQTGGGAAVLYRTPCSQGSKRIDQSNWAALRLKLEAVKKGLRVQVLKAVGSHAGCFVTI